MLICAPEILTRCRSPWDLGQTCMRARTGFTGIYILAVWNKSTIVWLKLMLTAACNKQYQDLLPNIFDLINRTTVEFSSGWGWNTNLKITNKCLPTRLKIFHHWQQNHLLLQSFISRKVLKHWRCEYHSYMQSSPESPPPRRPSSCRISSGGNLFYLLIIPQLSLCSGLFIKITV